MQQTIFIENLLDSLQTDFFVRATLASLEIMSVLQTQHWILYESFGIGAGGDESSGADLLAEAIFCKFFSPMYHIDSEEAGLIHGDNNAKYKIVLDPLDGSSNFKSNIPYYGASLALCNEKGRVCEAYVINYISREVSYLNDTLLQKTKIPYVFSINCMNFSLFSESHLQNAPINQMHLQQILSYQPINFAPLLEKEAVLQSQDIRKDVMTKKDIKGIIDRICEKILATKHYFVAFDTKFLQQMFEYRYIISRQKHIDTDRKLECGIFEKASYHHDWVERFFKSHLKFRSLGASALSIGFSFQHLFVFLPTKVRKYDGMASFYLAQNQNIYGNVEEYFGAIPILQKFHRQVQYILITSDSQIIQKITGR